MLQNTTVLGIWIIVRVQFGCRHAVVTPSVNHVTLIPVDALDVTLMSPESEVVPCFPPKINSCILLKCKLSPAIWKVVTWLQLSCNKPLSKLYLQNLCMIPSCP